MTQPHASVVALFLTPIHIKGTVNIQTLWADRELGFLPVYYTVQIGGRQSDVEILGLVLVVLVNNSSR